jgi:hypothetical protein
MNVKALTYFTLAITFFVLAATAFLPIVESRMKMVKKSKFLLARSYLLAMVPISQYPCILMAIRFACS